MSWVKERLEELGFADVAERLNRMTQPHRERPSKLSAKQLARKAETARRRRARLRAQEKA